MPDCKDLPWPFIPTPTTSPSLGPETSGVGCFDGILAIPPASFLLLFLFQTILITQQQWFLFLQSVPSQERALVSPHPHKAAFFLQASPHYLGLSNLLSHRAPILPAAPAKPGLFAATTHILTRPSCEPLTKDPNLLFVKLQSLPLCKTSSSKKSSLSILSFHLDFQGFFF